MKLTQTVVATSFAILASFSAGGQTLQPIDQLAVVDANGKTVGKFIELYKGDATEALVALKVNGLVFELWLAGNGLADNNNAVDLFFESADCSGQPFEIFLGYDSTPVLGGTTNVAIGAPGHTVYAPAGPPQSVTPMSYLDSTGTCNPVQYQPGGTALPIEALINVGTLFTPPFRLITTSANNSGAQCCGDCNGDGKVTIDELLTSVSHALNECPAP